MLMHSAEKSHLLCGVAGRGGIGPEEGLSQPRAARTVEQMEHSGRSIDVQGTKVSYSPFTPVR